MSTFYFVDLKILPQNRNSHFKGESVTKERGKKSPKRKNQILDLMEETAATENQLSLTLAPEVLSLRVILFPLLTIHI